MTTKWTRDDIAAHYEVSADGRVFSTAHNWRGYGRREIRQIPNADDYASVRLSIAGKRRHYAVHALVAMFHLPPRPDGTQLRHIDGNKLNPSATNLTWGSAKDNADDRQRHGRTVNGESHPSSKLTNSMIAEIRSAAGNGEPYTSIASRFLVTPEQIGNIVRRRSWNHV